MMTLVFSTHDYDRPYLEKTQNAKMKFSFCNDSLNIKTVNQANGFKYISVFGTDTVNEAVLKNLNDLGVRYIATRSVGFDHIDLNVARQLGIRVANVPDYSPYSVAEHAVALLMTFNRKILLSQKLMDENDFRLDNLVGFDIHGKTVGIVGLGKIGNVFASIMKGFGCEIFAYDIKADELAKDKGIEYLGLHELLKCSDIVYLTCPLNEKTYHLIGKNELQLMKPKSILINTARGAVIDTQALYTHLKNGLIQGACLDVYEFEKNLYFNNWKERKVDDELFFKLRALDNVLMTGHQGFLTQQALSRIAKVTYENLLQWVSGGNCENELN